MLGDEVFTLDRFNFIVPLLLAESNEWVVDLKIDSCYLNSLVLGMSPFLVGLALCRIFILECGEDRGMLDFCLTLESDCLSFWRRTSTLELRPPRKAWLCEWDMTFWILGSLRRMGVLSVDCTTLVRPVKIPLPFSVVVAYVLSAKKLFLNLLSCSCDVVESFFFCSDESFLGWDSLKLCYEAIESRAMIGAGFEPRISLTLPLRIWRPPGRSTFWNLRFFVLALLGSLGICFNLIRLARLTCPNARPSTDWLLCRALLS